VIAARKERGKKEKKEKEKEKEGKGGERECSAFNAAYS